MKQHRTLQDLKPWQQTWHRVIFGTDTPAGKLFDVILLWAILISVLVVLLESVQDLKQDYSIFFYSLEWIFTILFTLEYSARIITSPRPRKYILSFMGIIDLLSLIPTFLSLFITGAGSLLVIRSIRLIRVFRVLKLTHFMGGANQIGNALYNSRHKIVVFLGSVLCITVIMGTVMYLIEGPENGYANIPTSIYWAIVTITTVGYGDISPQTPLGQLIASILMILGYAIIAVPTGIVTSELTYAKMSAAKTCEKCGRKITIDDANYCPGCGHPQNSQENIE